MLFQFKIQIKGVRRPPVWRRIVVPAESSFLRFHEIIQVAFGWENRQNFAFSLKGYGSTPFISSSRDWTMKRTLMASKKRLSKIFDTIGQTYTYIYDFGDNWTHEIILEDIIRGRADYATCLAGRGKCPPENSGGAYGLENLKNALFDPDHEEHSDARECLGLAPGEEWDFDYFNREDTNENLKNI